MKVSLAALAVLVCGFANAATLTLNEARREVRLESSLPAGSRHFKFVLRRGVPAEWLTIENGESCPALQTVRINHRTVSVIGDRVVLNGVRVRNIELTWAKRAKNACNFSLVLNTPSEQDYEDYQVSINVGGNNYGNISVNQTSQQQQQVSGYPYGGYPAYTYPTYTYPQVQYYQPQVQYYYPQVQYYQPVGAYYYGYTGYTYGGYLILGR